MPSSTVPLVAAWFSALLASLVLQLPPSVAASAPKPLTEVEKALACSELNGMAAALGKDPAWMREPFSARELQQMQKVRDSLGCVSADAGFAGVWIIDSPPAPGSHAVTGRMTLKQLDTATGLKRSNENWGTFSLTNECRGSDQFYVSEDLTWNAGSYFIADYFLWGAASGTGSLLMCDDRGHFEGRFRANHNDGLGEGFKLSPYEGTLDGKVYLMAGRGPSQVPFVAKRGK